nr:MAG TPA: hypothetical protein [Caudoviricetes sp.]
MQVSKLQASYSRIYIRLFFYLIKYRVYLTLWT